MFCLFGGLSKGLISPFHGLMLTAKGHNPEPLYMLMMLQLYSPILRTQIKNKKHWKLDIARD